MNERAESIIQLVNKNPGIRYSEIMRETGLKNGVLSHYLAKIEAAGKITVARSPRVARLYPCGMTEEEAVVIKNLHSHTSRQILLGLLEQNMSFKEIVERVRRSPGTVSIVLKNLAADEIVDRKFHDGVIIFEIRNRALVSQAVARYKPKIIESAADNVSDIFGSL